MGPIAELQSPREIDELRARLADLEGEMAQLKSRPAAFMASIVGSSSNAAESRGDAPMRSPAETKAKWRFCARSESTRVASFAPPPAIPVAGTCPALLMLTGSSDASR